MAWLFQFCYRFRFFHPYIFLSIDLYFAGILLSLFLSALSISLHIFIPFLLSCLHRWIQSINHLTVCWWARCGPCTERKATGVFCFPFFVDLVSASLLIQGRLIHLVMYKISFSIVSYIHTYILVDIAYYHICRMVYQPCIGRLVTDKRTRSSIYHLVDVVFISNHSMIFQFTQIPT